MKRRTAILITVLGTGLALVGEPGAAPRGTVVIHAPRFTFPTAIGAGFGSIWVAEHRGLALLRINPSTNRVAATIDLPDSQCGAFTFGAGHAWISNCAGEAGVARTFEVDPRSNRVDHVLPGGFPLFAGGSLWTASYPSQRLLRIDPVTRVVIKTITLPLTPNPNGQATGAAAYGALWTTNSVDAVARIDLATNGATLIPLPGNKPAPQGGYFNALAPVFASGLVWVANAAGIYSIDPKTNAVTLHRLRIGPFSQWGDVGMYAARDALFVRVSDTRVVQLDTHSFREVKEYPASGGGGELLVSRGSLWVTNALDDTIWREPR